jgi:hypothetical protein
MEQAAAYIGKKPYNRIVIPGTHDSGTYGLISTYDRPVNDAFAPDAENFFVKAGTFAGIAEIWAKAQDNDIYRQLVDGIRAIDLRPCVEKNGNFRVCHSLYGPNLKDILRDVMKFSDDHPSEILLLRFSNFSETAPKEMSKAKHDELLNIIKWELGTRLVNHTTIRPSSTLEQIWDTDKSIIVVYQSDTPNNVYWGKDQLQDSWVDTWDQEYKKKSLVDHMKDYAAAQNTNGDQVFNLAGQATPNDKTIGLATLPTYPKNLRDLADFTNPVVLGWVKNEWSGAMNIVSLDFYNRTCLLPLTLQLNGVPGVSLTSCRIGTDTGWGDLRGSKLCPKGFNDAGLYCVKPDPYGRGVGTVPTGCPDGQEKNGGLCYARCRDGYKGAGPVCWKSCPDGYHDDGATCRRNPDDYGNKCKIGYKCKKGYKNTGCTCHRDAHITGKDSYGRGAGTTPKDCGPDRDYNAGLCYTRCKSGYHAVGGNICSPDCSAGMTDIGVACQK